MLEKTGEKIKRKLESKPLHHIDTSIIVESEKTPDGKICAKYLQKLNYNYNGKLSLPSLGELMIYLLLIKDSNKGHVFLDLLSDLRTVRKIGIYTPINLHEISTKIKEMDTRIDLTDLDIIACAIEDGANNMVTLDKKLIGNKAIENEFRLRIVHPRELL